MKTALFRALCTATLIWAGSVSTPVAAAGGAAVHAPMVVPVGSFPAVHRMELNADPDESSTEARWKREEVLHKKRGITGAGGDVSDYVAYVTVPVLVLIVLLALLRLPEC